MWELCLILLVGLIVLGPRQLAEVAKALGKVYREIQNMSWDFRRSIDQELKSTSDPPPQTYSPPVTPQSSGPHEAGGLLPGEKSGPDFYADLLEATAEKDQKSGVPPEPHSADDQEAEKKDDTPQEGKRP